MAQNQEPQGFACAFSVRVCWPNREGCKTSRPLVLYPTQIPQQEYALCVSLYQQSRKRDSKTPHTEATASSPAKQGGWDGRGRGRGLRVAGMLIRCPFSQLLLTTLLFRDGTSLLLPPETPEAKTYRPESKNSKHVPAV